MPFRPTSALSFIGNNVDIVANGAYAPTLATGGKYSLDLVGYGSTGGITQIFRDPPGGALHALVRLSPRITASTTRPRGVLQRDRRRDSHYRHAFVAALIPGRFDRRGGPLGSDDRFRGNRTAAAMPASSLDNISVTGAASPSPTSWALMIAGFGMSVLPRAARVSARCRLRLRRSCQQTNDNGAARKGRPFFVASARCRRRDGRSLRARRA